MLETQRKTIQSLTKLLDVWGAQYKIMFDGEEFGTLAVTTPKRKRQFRHPRGSLVHHFRPLIKDMQVADVVHVPVNQLEVKSLRGAISSWACTHWGNGAVMTAIVDDQKTVEVLRVA